MLLEINKRPGNRGITVRQLRRLLKEANPDALVMLEGPFSFITHARLDALPMALDNLPVVCIRGED